MDDDVLRGYSRHRFPDLNLGIPTRRYDGRPISRPIRDEKQYIRGEMFTPGSPEWFEDMLYGLPEQADPAATRLKNREDAKAEVMNAVPVLGEILSARDAYNNFNRASETGNWTDYLFGSMAAVGAVPLGGYLTRGFSRGRKLLDAALPAQVNRGLDNIGPSDPSRTTFMFAGPTAKTADHAALAKAQEMKAQGASRADIWRETGWDLEKADQIPRFEIDDSGARISGVMPPKSADQASTFNDIDHPEYKAAYPDYPEIHGVFDPRMREMGQYNPEQKAIFAQGPDEKTALSVGLHELQHPTQSAEGFAQGSNVISELAGLPLNTGNSIIEQLRKSIASGEHGSPGSKSFADAYKQLTNLEMTFNERRARDLYRRSAGEVEARNVQTRMNMTAAERRATPPWETQDVPDDQQIVRFR